VHECDRRQTDDGPRYGEMCSNRAERFRLKTKKWPRFLCRCECQNFSSDECRNITAKLSKQCNTNCARDLFVLTQQVVVITSSIRHTTYNRSVIWHSNHKCPKHYKQNIQQSVEVAIKSPANFGQFQFRAILGQIVTALMYTLSNRSHRMRLLCT